MVACSIFLDDNFYPIFSYFIQKDHRIVCILYRKGLHVCMYVFCCMYVCINILKYWFYSCETLHLSASLVDLKLLKPDSNEIMTYVVHRNRRNREKKKKKKNME